MAIVFVFLLGRDKLLNSDVTGRAEKNFNCAMRMNKERQSLEGAYKSSLNTVQLNHFLVSKKLYDFVTDGHSKLKC